MRLDLKAIGRRVREIRGCLYAAFTHGDQNSNGDPVADETATSIAATTKHQINLKISVPSGQAAGVYTSTLLFIATPTF